jgi:hypothetical protein
MGFIGSKINRNFIAKGEDKAKCINASPGCFFIIELAFSV